MNNNTETHLTRVLARKDVLALAFLARLHPTHRTPTNAIFVMGVLSCIAPFFGRPPRFRASPWRPPSSPHACCS